ncbi:hypothetical protein L1887_63116 [Cichorium endivia]|nr:hypothetical protein L1887_63116 [Cichorium endivia]
MGSGDGLERAQAAGALLYAAQRDFVSAAGVLCVYGGGCGGAQCVGGLSDSGAASVTLRSFLVALAEMLRRVCWNNLRGGERADRQYGLVQDRARPAAAKAHAVATHTPPSEGERTAGQEAEAEAEGVGAKRKSLIEGLRTKLVPDARSDEIGKSLDERAVTKGRSGRDYTPRRGEYDRGLVDVDSDDDDEEDDEEEDDAHEAHASSKEHTSDDGRGTWLPQPPPRAVPRQRRRDTPT